MIDAMKDLNKTAFFITIILIAVIMGIVIGNVMQYSVSTVDWFTSVILALDIILCTLVERYLLKHNNKNFKIILAIGSVLIFIITFLLIWSNRGSGMMDKSFERSVTGMIEYTLACSIVYSMVFIAYLIFFLKTNNYVELVIEVDTDIHWYDIAIEPTDDLSQELNNMIFSNCIFGEAINKNNFNKAIEADLKKKYCLIKYKNEIVGYLSLKTDDELIIEDYYISKEKYPDKWTALLEETFRSIINSKKNIRIKVKVSKTDRVTSILIFNNFDPFYTKNKSNELYAIL